MSRAVVCLWFLVAELAILFLAEPLRAAEPALPGGNASTGSVIVGEGRPVFRPQCPSGNCYLSEVEPAIPTMPAPASPVPGKVFYIIVEGAGLGDSVRMAPCTGKETVLDAIGQINGLSQVSSPKLWIARPSPGSPDKSTILPVDWDAISKRGINTTNHTLAPGDRLVIGEDPLVARANAVARKTGPLERVMGCVGLCASSLGSVSSAQAASEAVKEMVRKGMFTDDEDLRKIVLDAISRHEQENKKAVSKEAGGRQGQ